MKLASCLEVARNSKLNNAWGVGFRTEIIPQMTSLASCTGRGQCDLSKNSVFGTIISTREPQAKTNMSETVMSAGILILQVESWKSNPRSRSRNMFVSEGSEAVICRYEKIMAGYACRTIEGWLVRFDRRSIYPPFFLDGIWNLTPRSKSTPMDLQGFKLRGGCTECMGVPRFEETLAVPMIECDIAC